MVRSFHYAICSALFKHVMFSSEDTKLSEPWIDLWYQYVGGTFMRSYLRNIEGSFLIRDDQDELHALFSIYLLEKAVYEIGYELNNRPDWVIIPLNGITHLMEDNK